MKITLHLVTDQQMLSHSCARERATETERDKEIERNSQENPLLAERKLFLSVNSYMRLSCERG